MSDLNWCTYCDNIISEDSNSLYCSEKCLRGDALNKHPLLGHKYPEFKDFPRITFSQQQQQQSQTMDLNNNNDSNADDEDEKDRSNSNTQIKMKMESNNKPVDDQVFRLETVLSDSHHQQKEPTNYHYFSFDPSLLQ